MNSTIIFLVLIGVSATLAMPTLSQATSKKEAVRLLLQSGKMLQSWSNAVLDESEEGFNDDNIRTLATDGADASQRLEDTFLMVNSGNNQDFDENTARAAVDMLKVEAGTGSLTKDEKLVLITGDKVSTNTMRLRINLQLITRTLEVLDLTIAELEDLLDEDVTDEDIMEVLPELVEDLSSQGKALMIVFKSIEETFLDAEAEVESLVQDQILKGIEAKEETVDEVIRSRQRRSPGGFSRNLGRGWSVGTGGLSWSNRRGNVHFNTRPTFGRGGLGGQASIRIEF